MRLLVGLCLLASLSAVAENAYTNHAGYAVRGVPVRLDARNVALSNVAETVTVPLSIFPEPERRRIAADYVLGHPAAGACALRLPHSILRAVEADAKARRRAFLRAEKGLCSKADCDSFCERSSAALSAWLDEKEKAGEILPAERMVLSGRMDENGAQAKGGVAGE